VVNLISTLVGMAIIDKVGRKPCSFVAASAAASASVWWRDFYSNLHADWLIWLLGAW